MARLVAIDLGAYAVKVTTLVGSNRGHDLEQEVVQRVPQDGDALPTLETRLASLDLLLREHPEWASGSLVATCWPSDQASMRRVALPFTDDKQIAQTLPFAVETEVPFDLDDMVLAWQRGAVDVEAEDGPTPVHVTLVDEAAFSELLTQLAERGLDPRQVLVDGDVISTLAHADDPVTAYIDIGHAHTTVSVVRGGRAERVRSISVAGRTFTRVIQTALGCTWSDAEALKHGASADEAEVELELDLDGPVTDAGVDVHEDEATDPAFGGMPAKAREALHGAIGLLLAEVRSTLIAAEDDLGLEVARVVLMGGGARVADLPSFVEQDLGVPVVPARDAEELPIKAGFEVNRALAAHLHRTDVPVLDLRVGPHAFRGGLDLAQAVLTYGGAGLGMFLVAVLAMFAYQMSALNGEKAEVHERIAGQVALALPDVSTEGMEGAGMVSLLSDVVMDREAEARFLGTGSAVPPTVHLLHQLSQGLPAHPGVTMDVDDLEITPASITMKGVTDGFAAVDSIQSSLEMAGHWSTVNKSPGTRTRDDRLSFTMNLNRGDADELGDTDDGSF